jgi:hypothetical protein
LTEKDPEEEEDQEMEKKEGVKRINHPLTSFESG